MRLLICWILVFQFMASAVAKDLGEAQSFKSSVHLKYAHAKVEAQSFRTFIESGLEKIKKGELPKIELENQALPVAEEKALEKLLAKSARPIIFQETGPGVYAYRSHGKTVSFSLVELYQGQLRIDGRIFNFKSLPYSQIERELELFDSQKKTTWYQFIFENTVGVGEAQAILPLIIIGAVAAVIGLYALYQLKWKPESTVEKINKLTSDLEKSGSTCESSKTSEDSYRETFEMANSISERTTLNSVTSAEDALMLMIKEQLSNGERNEEDCYKLMHEAGKKLDVDIPLPSQGEIQRMSFNGGSMRFNKKTDVKGALYNMCVAYNALSSCMEQFVGSHVNSDGIDGFKENARENYKKWKRSNQSSRQ